MATLNINNDIYQRLSKKAVEQHTTVDELVLPVLEQLVQIIAPAEQREKAFEDWMMLVQKRSSRVPAGHVIDDSRESIYEGRGE